MYPASSGDQLLCVLFRFPPLQYSSRDSISSPPPVGSVPRRILHLCVLARICFVFNCLVLFCRGVGLGWRRATSSIRSGRSHKRTRARSFMISPDLHLGLLRVGWCCRVCCRCRCRLFDIPCSLWIDHRHRRILGQSAPVVVYSRVIIQHLRIGSVED